MEGRAHCCGSLPVSHIIRTANKLVLLPLWVLSRTTRDIRIVLSGSIQHWDRGSSYVSTAASSLGKPPDVAVIEFPWFRSTSEPHGQLVKLVHPGVPAATRHRFGMQVVHAKEGGCW